MAVYKGSCLCGAITYTLTGEPVTTVLCHCRNCQKSSGSSFQANLFYKQECLEFLTGEDKLTRYSDRDTDSGGVLVRTFCSICGSNIKTTNETSDFVRGHVVIASGCLDDAAITAFRPAQEFYCKSKSAWLDVLTGTHKFQAMT